MRTLVVVPTYEEASNIPELLPRIRDCFPETLLWRPELITDDAGRASLDLDLADSITTWRLSAGAVAADGRLGASQSAIKVFQPFFVELNLPVIDAYGPATAKALKAATETIVLAAAVDLVGAGIVGSLAVSAASNSAHGRRYRAPLYGLGSSPKR